MSLLLLPAPALSQEPIDQSPSPSVDQYRESLPTTKGPRPAAQREARPARRLSPEARAELRREAGADAEALEALATDPGLGAPEPTGGGRDDDASRSSGRTPSDASAGVPPAVDRSALGATADATVGSGVTAVLLLGLAGVAAAVGFAVARRRRSQPD